MNCCASRVRTSPALLSPLRVTAGTATQNLPQEGDGPSRPTYCGRFFQLL